jgi:hypothetical protein
LHPTGAQRLFVLGVGVAVSVAGVLLELGV